MKTSGSKGFHIAVPLDGKADAGEVSGFAHAVGSILVARDPDHLTQEFSKADRGGRILVDTGRNGYSATFAAAYAVRAKPGAPVSAPCTWEELERGEAGPRTFTLRTMAGRIADVGDLWSDMRKRKASLRRPIAQVRKMRGALAPRSCSANRSTPYRVDLPPIRQRTSRSTGFAVFDTCHGPQS